MEPLPKLAPLDVFLRRQGVHLAIAMAILAVGLGIGVLGYHWLAHLGWVDSLLNASMILSGMGPVDRLETQTAKIFASAYALFGGLLFMITMGIVVSPLAHRLLHRLHLEEEERSRRDSRDHGES